MEPLRATLEKIVVDGPVETGTDVKTMLDGFEMPVFVTVGDVLSATLVRL